MDQVSRKLLWIQWWLGFLPNGFGMRSQPSPQPWKDIYSGSPAACERRNFHQTAISRAKTACEVSGHRPSDHFGDGGTVFILQTEHRYHPWPQNIFA